jgi:uncharacterized protein YdaU (DUF1376 family)
MAKDPAVLLYTSDFISGTITMTHEQRGKYILLLCIQHQKGKLTEKDLKAILNEEDIEVAEKFDKGNDGFYYNKRMLEESIKRKTFTDSRKANGNKGGRPPKVSLKPNDKPNGYPNDKPTNNHIENENATVNVNTDANTVLNKIATVNQSSATGNDFKPKYSEEQFDNIFND